MKTLITFVAGCLVGGLVGGVAGYVINDLTDRDNPEVIAEIEEEARVQEEFDDFLDQLAATPPPTASPAVGSGDAIKPDSEAAADAAP